MGVWVSKAHDENLLAFTHSYSYANIGTHKQAFVAVNEGQIISGQTFLPRWALHQGAGEWAVGALWRALRFKRKMTSCSPQ